MTRRMAIALSIAVLLFNVFAIPAVGRTQQTDAKEDDGIFYLGSFVLSILYLPVKAATCLGTQAGAAVAYTATYGVAGTDDGETHGKEIGEVARRSCSGPWILTPEQIKKDYGH